MFIENDSSRMFLISSQADKLKVNQNLRILTNWQVFYKLCGTSDNHTDNNSVETFLIQMTSEGHKFAHLHCYEKVSLKTL
jgi:hypothetical protein